MQSLARAALRPALLAGRAGLLGTDFAPACAPCVAAGPALLRHWSSTPPATPPDDKLRKAERMVELMASSPSMQQMMMAVMPAAMRSPEVLKQMFGDPAMRKRIAEMIASRGLAIPDHLLDRMTPGAMDDTFARAQRLGIDPAQLFTKLMAHPGLLAKLQQPHVMAAFLDIAEDPARQSKYEGDKELLEVVHKVRELLGSTKPQVAAPAAAVLPPADGDASSSTPIAMPPPPGQPAAPEPEAAASSSSSEASGSAADQPGINPLVALMGSDPKAAKWLDNAKVMAALEQVHKSPWKTVKYIFDRDVMEAFKDLKELMRGRKL